MPALAILAAAALAAAPPVVAVTEVKPTEGVSAGTASLVTDMVTQELASSGRAKVLARADVLALLGYQQMRQTLGCADASCLASAGNTLGADYVLAGTLGKLGSQYRIGVALVDVKKGEAAVREQEFCPAEDDALPAAAKALAARLAGAFPGAGAGSAAVGADPQTAAKALAAADQLAAQKKHAQAAAAYEEYATRFPAEDDRCRALALAGSQWERAGDRLSAARRFLAVGTDAACASGSPDGAALALDKAASLFERTSHAPEATAAREALVKLAGVTGSQARFRQDAARTRLESDAKLK